MPIEGKDIIVCSTPCRPEFKKQAEYMMSHSDVLFKVVSTDYSSRWPDLIPPSLEDCILFVNSIIPEIKE